MWNKIVAFFMSIFAFIASLFGINVNTDTDYRYTDLAYGSHERQVLDLCLPEGVTGDMGLVLMIHGGAWIAGDKEGYKEALEYASSSLGVAAAAINYRYLGENVTMYEILDDIDAALALIKEKGENVGLDINKVLLTGSSAGAHLSLLYAYSRATTAPVKPVAVVSDCGPTDLTDEAFYINNALGNEETIADLLSLCIGIDFSYAQRGNYVKELQAISPLFYVDENTVPTVINHGMQDNIVPFSNATAVVEKLKENGVKHDFNIYPNSGHGLDNDPDSRKIADELMHSYIKTYLIEN